MAPVAPAGPCGPAFPAGPARPLGRLMFHEIWRAPFKQTKKFRSPDVARLPFVGGSTQAVMTPLRTPGLAVLLAPATVTTTAERDNCRPPQPCSLRVHHDATPSVPSGVDGRSVGEAARCRGPCHRAAHACHQPTPLSRCVLPPNEGTAPEGAEIRSVGGRPVEVRSSARSPPRHRANRRPSYPPAYAREPATAQGAARARAAGG